MSRQAYLIHDVLAVDGAQWAELLGFCLDQAHTFRIFLPDDEELSPNRGAVLSLSGIQVTEWNGMPGSVQVYGRLTEEAKSLILQSQNSDDLRLWSFEIHANGQNLLRVEDFSVCLVFATSNDLRQLERRGVNPALLQAVNLAPQLSPGARVVPLSEDEVAELRTYVERSDEPENGAS